MGLFSKSKWCKLWRFRRKTFGLICFKNLVIIFAIFFIKCTNGEINSGKNALPSFDRSNRFSYATDITGFGDISSSTEFSNVNIIDTKIYMEKKFSPYLVREDVVIHSTGELIIEPGVEVRFAPMIGITVYGAILAKGDPESVITFTSIQEPHSISSSKSNIRLVDGPSVLAGRLQIWYNENWRSVCTNSRNWTKFDMETVCRELGFDGGNWWNWVDKEPGISQPRLLLEQPNCHGGENSISDCSNWQKKQLGSGACDYHPDIGIQCLERYSNKGHVAKYWRGLQFMNARFERVLTQQNTLYVRHSFSHLSNLVLRYGGVGRDYAAVSAIHIEGVPPLLESVTISSSAYNGLNITNPNTAFTSTNISVIDSRGYGIYVNSSTGHVLLNNCNIDGNGGDGIKYVHHDSPIIERSDLFDFCSFPMTSSQTFPIAISFEQNMISHGKNCNEYFFTRNGQVLTLYFQQMTTSKNDSATIEIYDGKSTADVMLARILIRNGTKPQSVTTTRNNVFVKYSAEAKTDVSVFMKIISSFGKWYDINVTNSVIEDNNGRGIWVENIRSQLYVKGSNVSNNRHVAGIHVSKGAAYVNITDSKIIFNKGDGVNITHTGGSRNISGSSISYNTGYGIAVWLNETKYSEHVSFNQETVIADNKIIDNIEYGVIVGNFCANSIVNISGNDFHKNRDSCIEILSCLKQHAGILKLQIGHNDFKNNHKNGIKLSPFVNGEAIIEYNKFSKHSYGTIMIKNGINEQLNLLPAKVVIKNNEFLDNSGIYVLNIGLSPYSEVQKLSFTWNFVRNNRVKEPFEHNNVEGKLIPRSRVAAVIVVSSENVNIFRNIINNHESKYEIGSHLEDQSQIINCTYNWLGYAHEEKIYSRLFHRKDRYNLAKIEFLPYLLHSSNPAAGTIMSFSTYVPEFYNSELKLVGGEVDGLETLRSGEYVVQRDINVRPGGRLSLEQGVTLRFPPGIGMMVAGKFDARGKGPGDIKLTLVEETLIENYELNNTENAPESSMSVRLFGGRTQYEGRLQVKVDGKWGTVCNYGWTVQDASLVCHQLGLILNVDDWFLDHSEIPQGGSSDPILLSNVRCSEDDLNIENCRAERAPNFENSCTHNEDVGMRCYEPKWAGMRFGVLAERSNLQHISIEHAGLLDYATDQLKPALQIDFNRHTLENIRVSNNIHDGLGIIYSDLYSVGTSGSNIVKNCDFINNRGAGISIKQLGLKATGCNIMDNKVAGIRHDPVISMKQQQEITGWFKPMSDIVTQYTPYTPLYIPAMDGNIQLENGETKFLITERLFNPASINKTYTIMGKPGYILGIQLLNPIQNLSTEQIVLIDSHVSVPNAQKWILKRDLSIFPTVSRSFGIILEYESGINPLGNVVLIITSLPAHLYDRLSVTRNAELTPLLSFSNTRIKRNRRGIWSSYYNRHLSDLGEHYLRKSNESIWFSHCDISFNEEEAFLVHSPFWDAAVSNISEITIVVNNSMITDNGRGIYQFGRDLTNSNNLYHWVLNDNALERNEFGGFEVSLPYVWQYNENYTHSISLHNNTWRDNRHFSLTVDGHYAQLNLTYNILENNTCKEGLISIRGMEKSVRIYGNTMEYNTGSYMIEFKANSQSEIRGDLYAVFKENKVKRNNPPSAEIPSSLIVFDGIQRVRIQRNLLSDNTLAYSLVAGVKTAQIDSQIDVTENWWGTTDALEIKRTIFDFDDWNDHALAKYIPYLMEDDIYGPISVTWEQPIPLNIENLAGRLSNSFTIYRRDNPYRIYSDITIMPEVTLAIESGTILEFAPRVGMLVLGTLIAKGGKDNPIIMRPLKQSKPKIMQIAKHPRSLRLCTGYNCSMNGGANSEGFLEYWNTTTFQWVPICDKRFTETNAQVVCRELGLETVNVWFTYGRRYEFFPNALMRIWSWPEPLQCTGNEKTLEDCPVRLNGQMYGKIPTCSWDSMFVFVHCGAGNLQQHTDYWGGIRFANANFESTNFEDRIHDEVTHETMHRDESILENVQIIGAGSLHYHKSPAILSVRKSPELLNVNISHCASNGISLFTPEREVKLLSTGVTDCLGIGITIASLTGEGRESHENSFTPVQKVELPYNTFSLLDMCDPMKEIVIQEKILLYYKHSNSPVTCIKIFHSAYHVKTFGFRFLQFNLLNKTDKIDLYEGSIYNTSSTLLKTITATSGIKKEFIKTQGPTLSIKIVVCGATQYHGFIAEIVTLPISAIGFNRDVQHNISYSLLSNNWGGALYYVSAGEINPKFTIEWTQITNNCRKLYGNFTSCDSAVVMDLQNTQNVYLRNNLVMNNEGGIWIRADSRGSATSLKCWIHNNLFTNNKHQSTLYVEGRQTSPYQEVVIYRNYWANNYSPYVNVINLNQVVSNFTFNYVQNNIGSNILEISGFEGVRLPIYQTTSHNGFYWNYATERDAKGTIVAGTAGQHYVHNILYNPDNDYEIITVNHSTIDVWKTAIDARNNYWGFNESFAVAGRIHDYHDDYNLLEVDFRPFQITNTSILDGKCPPGWNLVGDTCYVYIGAPMSFHAARDFCRSANSSMPYVSNYAELYKFLTIQQEGYMFYDRVWMQNIDRINKCTVFVYETVEEDNCHHLHPFLCEMDPKVMINPLNWRSDVITLSVLSSVILSLLLLAVVIIFWYSKSKHRHVERLQRRNSIRQSLNSLRSISSSQGGFSELGIKRKALSSQQSSPIQYKKVNGSLDSVGKSHFNSSLEEDIPTYDTYEIHNPPASTLSFQNQGYRDNSTFASSCDNLTWQSTDYINNSSTLPLTSNLPVISSTATLASKQDYQQENEYNMYYERPKSSTILETNLDEPGLPPIPPRSKSEMLLETNLDVLYPPFDQQTQSSFYPPPSRSKSQPLETAM